MCFSMFSGGGSTTATAGTSSPVAAAPVSDEERRKRLLARNGHSNDKPGGNLSGADKANNAGANDGPDSPGPF